MAQPNPKTNEEQPPEPTLDPPVGQDTSSETTAFGNSSSDDAGLKLAEETEGTNGINGNGSDSSVGGNGNGSDATTADPADLQAAPDDVAAPLRELFSSVDRAISQNANLPADIQRLLGEMGWKQIQGSDTRALTSTGDSTSGSFHGFSLEETPNGAVMTKVYENGSVVTKFASGLEVRFPPNGDFAEISVNGAEPQRVPKSEASIPIASVNGDGYKLTQKADGTVTIDFEKAQYDGATSMTFHPANPEGLKWTRNIPEANGIPAHRVSARTDSTITAEFAEPMGSVSTAQSSGTGDIRVSLAAQPESDEPNRSDEPEEIDESGESAEVLASELAALVPPDDATNVSHFQELQDATDTESGDSADLEDVEAPEDEEVPEDDSEETSTSQEERPGSGPLGPEVEESLEEPLESPSTQPRLELIGGVEILPLGTFLGADATMFNPDDLTQLQALRSASSPQVAMALIAQLDRINSLPSLADADPNSLRIRPSIDPRPSLLFDPLGRQTEDEGLKIGTKEEQRLLKELAAAPTREQALAILMTYNTGLSRDGGRLDFDTATGAGHIDSHELGRLGPNYELLANQKIMEALQQARSTSEFKDILAFVTRFGTPGELASPLVERPSLFPGLTSERPGRTTFRPALIAEAPLGAPYLVNPPPRYSLPEVNLQFLRPAGEDNPFSAFLPRASLSPSESGPPEWQETFKLVDQMSQAKDQATASEALRALSERARGGDKHAQTALAATYLALEGGNAGLAKVYQMNLQDAPIFAPQLDNLDPKTREALRHQALSELSRQAGSDSKTMPKEALMILATTFELAQASFRTESADTIAKVIQKSAGSDEGSSAFWRLHNMDKPFSDNLMKMFMDGMAKNPNGQFYIESLGRGAAEGNKEDIRLLSLAVSSGNITNRDVSTAALNGLRDAAKAGHGDEIFKTLKDVYTQHGDNGRLLETLGAIASDGSLSDTNFETTKRLLRDGVRSKDPEVQDSAVQGMLRMPEKWTEADVNVLARHMTPVLAESLKDVVAKIEPEQAKKLAQLVQNRLDDGGYGSAVQTAAGITALGALSDVAGPDAARVIKEAANDSRFTESGDAAILTRAGVSSLMRLGGSMNPGADSALNLLRADGWKADASLPMDRPEFRDELARFVTGDIARTEMSMEAKHIAYDSGFPQSIHRMFRDLGVAPDVLDMVVDNARSHYDDATIRDVIARTALYNAVPEDLRGKLFGPVDSQTALDSAPLSPRIELMQVLGQMANGTLEQSSNNILLKPIEKTVQEIQDAFGKEQRRVAASVSHYQSAASDELKELTKLTSEGVTTWNHFASWFGNQTLNQFLDKQDARLVNYESATEIGKLNQQRLGVLTGITQSLSGATDAFKYEQYKSSGNEREADLLAVQMLKDHGPLLAQRAPDVWRELGLAAQTPASKETVFQRLHRAGLAESPDSPRIRYGTHDGFADGIQILSTDLDEGMVDSRVRQTLALLAVDMDPGMAKFSDSIRDLQSRMPALQELVSAGMNGTRSAKYAGDVRHMIQDFQRVYDEMNVVDPTTKKSPAQAARDSLRELSAQVKNMDPQIQHVVQERIKAMEQMLNFLDPNSESGKELRMMFNEANSNSFSESGFVTWLQGDGIKTLGAIAVGVAAAAAVVALGPFAIAAAGVAGGIIGYEAMAETLFQLQKRGYVNTGEMTGAQLFNAGRGGLRRDEFGRAVDATIGHALAQHGMDFLKGTAIALATMGAGAILSRAIVGMRGGAAAGFSSNSAGFGRLASRVQQVERAAERVGGKALMQKWMSNFSHEFGEEIVEEAMSKGAEAGMEQVLGDVNPVLSVLASAVIANRKLGGGFDVNAHRGGHVDIHIDKDVDPAKTMDALRQQLQADGLMVDWNGEAGTPMKVTTPEGEVLTLMAKEASSEVADGQPVEGGKTEVASADPNADIGSDSGTASGDTAAGTPTARHEQIRGLVQQLNQASGDPTKQAEIEAQIKDVLVEQAKDYAKRLGLVTRDSTGQITGYLINPEQIALVRGRTPSSFMWTNEMEINIDDPDMMSTLLHEMRHQKDYYALTVQRLASDMGGQNQFEQRLQDEVFSEVLTGDTRVVTSDGRYEISAGLLKHIPQLPELLKDFHETVKGKMFSAYDAENWLAQNHPEIKLSFMSNLELGQLMVESVAKHVPEGGSVAQPRKELIEHPELRKPLSNLLKEFSADRPSGQATPAEIEAFLASKDLSAFDQANMKPGDVAELMAKELDHYRHVYQKTSMTPAEGDGSYAEQLRQQMEASGNLELFNELMRRAGRVHASGDTVELDHLTRGIVDSRLGMAQEPVEYDTSSPMENGARLIEATQALSALIDRQSGDYSQVMDRIAFESRAMQFTRTFSRFRSETDPQKQSELFEQSKTAAKRYAELLPATESGADMARRLLKLGLISDVPPQFQAEIDEHDLDSLTEEAAMRKLSPHVENGSASLPPLESSNILDRALSEDKITADQRKLYEKAVADGIFTPVELSRLLNDVHPDIREFLVPSLLRKGMLTPEGGHKLMSLSQDQLAQLPVMSGNTTSGAPRYDLYIAMLNNPGVDSLALGKLLSRTPPERAAYENFLGAPDKFPSAEAIGKLLEMSPATAASFESLAKLPGYREKLIGLMERRGAGQLALIGQLSTMKGLEPGLSKKILDATTDSADVKGDPEKVRREDEKLARFTELMQTLPDADAKALLSKVVKGSLSLDTVATISRAMGQGYFAGGMNLNTLLLDTAKNVNAVAEMLELDMATPAGERVGATGLMRVMGSVRRGRAIEAFDQGIITPKELHSLMKQPDGFTIADTILPNPDGTTFSKATVEQYLRAISENRIPHSTLESIRQAAAEKRISDKALANILSQPPEVSAKLLDSFDKLWTERSIRHQSLDEPRKPPAGANETEIERYHTRMREFRNDIVADNVKFLKDFVAKVESNPGDPSTLDMVEERLRRMDTSDRSVARLEPLLVPSAGEVALDGSQSVDVPPDVREFAEALARRDYDAAIKIAMYDRSSHVDQYTPVNLTMNDLDNPARMEQIIAQMDRIGFAKMTSDQSTEGERGSESKADLGQPILTLPSGLKLDLSKAKIEILNGTPSAQDLALIEQLKNHPSFQVLRGRVALTAYEERMIHNRQGEGGAQSHLAREFAESPEYKELEKRHTQGGKLLEAMREIDVAARLVDSGMSVEDVKKYLGDRHLSGEREFFYRWLESRKP